MIQKVKVEHIRTAGIQTRIETRRDIINEYCESYLRGDPVPALVLFDDGTSKWLGDGFHRLPAAKKAGFTEIECDVRKGTRNDALLFNASATCNDRHGLRRTPADRRHAAAMILRDKDLRSQSDRQIASNVGVRQSVVAELRKEIGAETDVRVDKQGRRINTAKIVKGGRRPSIAEVIANAMAEIDGKGTVQAAIEEQNDLKREYTDTSEEKAEAHAKSKEKALAMIGKLRDLLGHLPGVASALKVLEGALAKI